MNKKVKAATEAPIYTHQDVHAFIWNCFYELGVIFHPDNQFYDYVDDKGKRVFSKKDATILDKKLEECLVLCEKEKYDIYGIALSICDVSTDMKWGVSYAINIRFNGKREVGIFLLRCKNNLGIDFEIDNEFTEYVEKNGRPRFTSFESTLLQNTLDLCTLICGMRGWDIYEIADQFYKK